MSRVVAFLGCCSIATLCIGQDGNGRLVGQVVDHTGRQLPGVTIVATSGDVRREVRVEADGNYEISDLRQGAYTITATLTGFRPETKRIELHPSETSTADFAFRVACISSTITISSHIAIFSQELSQASDMVADLLIEDRREDHPFDPDCSNRYRAKVIRALRHPMSAGQVASEIDLVFDRNQHPTVELGREYLAWLSWRADRNAYVIVTDGKFVWPVVENQVKYFNGGVDTVERREPWEVRKSIDELFQMLESAGELR